MKTSSSVSYILVARVLIAAVYANCIDSQLEYNDVTGVILDRILKSCI